MFLWRGDALQLMVPLVGLWFPDPSILILASEEPRALRGVCGAPFRWTILFCVFKNGASGYLQLCWNSKLAERLWIPSVLVQTVVRASPDQMLLGDRCAQPRLAFTRPQSCRR